MWIDYSTDPIITVIDYGTIIYFTHVSISYSHLPRVNLHIPYFHVSSTER